MKTTTLKGKIIQKKKGKKKEREQSLINCWLVLQSRWGFFYFFIQWERREREMERGDTHVPANGEAKEDLLMLRMW